MRVEKGIPIPPPFYNNNNYDTYDNLGITKTSNAGGRAKKHAAGLPAEEDCDGEDDDEDDSRHQVVDDLLSRDISRDPLRGRKVFEDWHTIVSSQIYISSTGQVRCLRLQQGEAQIEIWIEARW